jgi:AraC family transcriptional activator of mtrCDE
MDPLTQLMTLVQPQASLQLRCQLEGAFSIDHVQENEGTIPFHLVLDGQCRIESGQGADIKALTLHPGDFLLFPHGGAHRIRDYKADVTPAQSPRLHNEGMLPTRRNGSGKPDIDLLCGHFLVDQKSAGLLFDTLPDPLHIALTGKESLDTLQMIVTLMRSEADQQAPGALAIVTALSQALLVMALRLVADQLSDTASILHVLTDARLSIAVRALLAEPGRAWTIEELGDVAAMSRATFARQFHAKIGVTVADFLLQVRMASACKLLRDTRRSIADIGLEVGYQSEAAFGKAFRIHVGHPPGKYRLLQK